MKFEVLNCNIAHNVFCIILIIISHHHLSHLLNLKKTTRWNTLHLYISNRFLPFPTTHPLDLDHFQTTSCIPHSSQLLPMARHVSTTQPHLSPCCPTAPLNQYVALDCWDFNSSWPKLEFQLNPNLNIKFGFKHVKILTPCPWARTRTC